MIKVIGKIKQWLGYRKFKRSCIRIHGYYSEIWDVHLNQLMDSHDFIITGPHTARLGEINIWVSNHPYASFRRYDILESTNLGETQHPSIKTLYRAGKKLEEDKIKQFGHVPTNYELFQVGFDYLNTTIFNRYDIPPKNKTISPNKNIKKLRLC